MAITAAFGMGNGRRPGHLGANAYVGPRLHMGRASLVVADASADSDIACIDGDSSNEPQQPQLGSNNGKYT
ncbi:hypothetical protein FBU31_003847 [Coemansia sp. 'formosensis']|nr:hypothetical protein FBU31_003847 [Coemansia sp. 'formosensis']